KRAKVLAPYLTQTQSKNTEISLLMHLLPSISFSAIVSLSLFFSVFFIFLFVSDIHTEAVQAALAKHKEEKMALPMPTKRRSAYVQSPIDNCTPPDSSSSSDDEAVSSESAGPQQSPDTWINSSLHGSSTSSSASSTLSHGESRHDLRIPRSVESVRECVFVRLSHPTLPDPVPGVGVPVSSRVSTKIQQLLNTLKRPKRPPLSEFFMDDQEEIVEVPQADPNTPKPEGRQIIPVKGEPLGVVSNWPPALQAALARWGATQGKSPALTALDITGKPLYTLTYGKLWSRSVKLAYTLLNKLGTKNEQIIKPGDRVALVYPNSDPGMFWVAFYGCLLAEVIPVPIEVPLSRKDAGSSQVGFLLGSCGVGLALTSEICLKGLPKTPTGEILQFKGWPRLKWVVTDSKYLTKPSKDWQPHIPTANTDTAYIEYKASKEGTVMGVAVSKVAMLTHCQALTQACNYCEGETLVNVLDFKKDMGLWHGVLTSIMNRIHTISVPYAVMKACPQSWVQRVHIHKARVALAKCRDLHWAMMAHREQRDTSLASLRMLIVADGANPWSVSSCDAFLNVFQAHGLKSEVICPCATSPEAMTVAIRRPGVAGAPLPARAVLSMTGLSHGVIRVNTEDKNSALTVQDVGHVMPGALMCIVKPDGPPMLCKTDEIGEIVVNSRAGGTMYYGLSGVTKNTFEVIPVNASGTPIGEIPFVRSGLLGFVGPGSLIFVVGKNEGLLMVSGRRHNADDLVATALAVEPVKTVYRGRIAVFSVTVFYDERIVIVAEQRPDASEEDSFQWMSRVLQAIDSIHQVGLYCLALVPANTLPKTPLGGIHISDTKQLFLEGALHPCNILMCPHTCVTNMPKPRQKQPVGVGPASIMVGNLVAGKRIAQAAGRDLGLIEDQDLVRKVNSDLHCIHHFLTEALQWRAQTDPDHTLYVLLNAKGVAVCTATCVQLHKRAEKIAAALMERSGINIGENVVLLYPPGKSHILCPVLVVFERLGQLKNYIGVKVKVTYPWFSPDDLPRKRPPTIYKPPNAEMIAYMDFSVSTTGMLTGVKVRDFSHHLNRFFLVILGSFVIMSPLDATNASFVMGFYWFCLVSPGHGITVWDSANHNALDSWPVRAHLAFQTNELCKNRRVSEMRGIEDPHNATEYYTIYGEENLQADHFNTKLSFGDPQTLWARTGYLGFVKRTELTDSSGDRHDALFVVGSLDETLELRGLRYHPIDIETSVSRAHRSIGESAVFTWTNLLVVVAELCGSEQDALDLVPLVTNVVLEEHHLIVGVVVIVDPGVIPINSRGEKQRMHLRDSFLADQLDPIYVAYNM
uniref:Disco-interacting protein 2 homolog B-A-like n=1 Tax=Sinocyclocheilus grahami TaxID=75366 RepID=A0A672P3M3_SINGR